MFKYNPNVFKSYSKKYYITWYNIFNLIIITECESPGDIRLVSVTPLIKLEVWERVFHFAPSIRLVLIRKLRVNLCIEYLSVSQGELHTNRIWERKDFTKTNIRKSKDIYERLHGVKLDTMSKSDQIPLISDIRKGESIVLTSLYTMKNCNLNQEWI